MGIFDVFCKDRLVKFVFGRPSFPCSRPVRFTDGSNSANIFISANYGANMILPTDIHTLDSFRRKTKQHVERLQSTGRPEVLTVNGKPSVVVQDAAAYQHQIEKIAVLEALSEAAKQADSGHVHDARRAVQKLLDELKSR